MGLGLTGSIGDLFGGGANSASALANTPAWAGQALGTASSLLGGYMGNQASARQARYQRDFEERMSSTAHQREVKDLTAAGLNPILSGLGGSGSSTPPGASAQQQDIVTPAVRTAVDIRREQNERHLAQQQLNNMEQTRHLTAAQTVAADAQATESYSGARLKDAQAGAVPSQIGLTGAQADVARKSLDEIGSRISLNASTEATNFTLQNLNRAIAATQGSQKELNKELTQNQVGVRDLNKAIAAVRDAETQNYNVDTFRQNLLLAVEAMRQEGNLDEADLWSGNYGWLKRREEYITRGVKDVGDSIKSLLPWSARGADEGSTGLKFPAPGRRPRAGR
ncbi:MAG: DNA pilot protein [Microvirus sp.]|nr:MAG: DNA pilot protein [Microvirus sp.]